MVIIGLGWLICGGNVQKGGLLGSNGDFLLDLLDLSNLLDMDLIKVKKKMDAIVDGGEGGCIWDDNKKLERDLQWYGAGRCW